MYICICVILANKFNTHRIKKSSECDYDEIHEAVLKGGIPVQSN